MRWLLLLAACGSDPPPSCSQALTHYYQAGCEYRNLTTGAQIPVGDMIYTCQGIAANAPDHCQGALDAWLVCLDASAAPDCDCSVEQMAVLRCR